MQILSVTYAAFVSAAVLVYYRLSRTGQNIWLTIASLAFCAAFDYRAAALLVATTVADYILSRQLAWERPESLRRRALWCSIGLNVLTLAAAKYLRLWSIESPRSLGVWLSHELRTFAAIGLSFYTLARLTHTLDVYFRVLRPAPSLVEFGVFVSLFPQLTAGPIERARNILPQLAVRRAFDLARCYEALWLIAIGLFKKVYVADHAALFAKRLLDGDARVSSAATLLGLYAYAVQIYADFAGYSDIARGVVRLFGIEVMPNFAAPYSSVNLAEYWKRWHISLSSFLEDYVHRPLALALRDHGEAGLICALWVTFTVSGLWHGTGWTFVTWGALHAAGLSALALSRKLRKRLRQRLPRPLMATGSRLLTFHYVCLGYLFFRAPTLSAAGSMLRSLGSPFSITYEVSRSWGGVLFFSGLALLLDRLEAQPGGAFWIFRQATPVRALCYAALLLCVMRLFAPGQEFIYAEF